MEISYPDSGRYMCTKDFEFRGGRKEDLFKYIYGIPVHRSTYQNHFLSRKISLSFYESFSMDSCTAVTPRSLSSVTTSPVICASPRTCCSSLFPFHREGKVLMTTYMLFAPPSIKGKILAMMRVIQSQISDTTTQAMKN